MGDSDFKPVVKGDVFPDSTAVTKAIQRSFLHTRTGCTSTGGGGYSKVFFCAGRKYDKERKKEVGCRARIRACRSRRKNLKLWKITDAYLVHNNCSGQQENASLAAVEDIVAKLVRANPSITGPGIRKHLQTVDAINCHPRTALRAKAKTLGRTERRNKEGFTALQSLLDQLGLSDRVHTNVMWEKTGRFKCCFVLVPGAATVAAKSPNRAFSLDGAHLSGTFNGTILTITTTDANNKVNIVAFAVVRKENAWSYTYLLQQAMRCKQTRKFLNNKTTTCFTDGQNGVDAVVTKVCPLTELHNCLEHLMRRRVGRVGKVGKGHAYSAARSMTKVGFDFSMGLLRDIAPEGHDKLEAIPHELWARYASRENVCGDQVTTNPSETANSMLRELRRLPVFDLVHGSILLIAKRLCDASELKKDDPDQVFTPYAMDQFNKATSLSRKLTAQPLGGSKYLVSDSKTGSTRGHKASVAWRKGSSETPRPPEFECSCGVPQKMLLPCSHVVATVKAQGKTREALSLINKRFKISRYRSLAAAYPIDMPVWDTLEKDPSKKPPRRVKRLDGKAPSTKRTTRIRSLGEGPASKKRKTGAKG
eukprot:g9008.t1